MVYLIINKDNLSHFDAHYFPAEDIIFSRISEPKNYSGKKIPLNKTGLCIEIPCDNKGDLWNMEKDLLISLVTKQLKKVSLSVDGIVLDSFIKKINFVYPIYDLNFEKNLKIHQEYINKFKNIITHGRQGSFAHDNTHHTIEMAYKASECINNDIHWDEKKWKEYILEFENHVVED